jgi:ZIP family zinc transporter
MTHSIVVLAVACAAFAATMIGGLFALWFRDKLHLILGFSAGAVIAVAFFDLIPESLELGRDFGPSKILSVTAIGFFVYVVLDRLVALNARQANDHGDGRNVGRGWAGAGSLSIHSVMDGFAMGIAFQASAAIGAVVAMAVLTHDFSDGINTVSLVVKNGGKRRQAFAWLLTDALAPVLGAAASLFVILPAQALAFVLAIFGGFFLYIGASDLLPESHHAHPKFLTTLMTLFGAGVLYIITQIAR